MRNAGDDEASAIKNYCDILSRMALGLGQTVAGMWTWDLMRLIDYIATRDDCAPAHIGCAGLSGGGLQCLWLAALDDRVKCAVISGNFFGFKDSLLRQIRCHCSYVPHLLEYMDVGDIAALIAPRALLIESGTQDVLSGERGIANGTEQVQIARQAYRLLETEQKLYHYIYKGIHMWNGEKTYPFVDRWL